SRGMYTILKRSGWGITVINQGESEKNEVIYLLHLSIDSNSQQQLIRKIQRVHNIDTHTLASWPLVVPSMTK
ncbi:acyl-homoserine-lactone synthase, partial [Yersinia pestis]